MSGKNAMHTAETVEHYTPPHIVEAARRTLGTIDLDPASCELANRTVRALTYWTKEDDGLTREPPQGARVFCNPPGGKAGNESVQKNWWRRWARLWREMRIDALLWVAFKVDFLQVTQVDAAADDVLPLDGAICYPRERVAYYRPSRNTCLPGMTDAALEVGASPPHASAIVYLPSHSDPQGFVRFSGAFSPIGAVRLDANTIEVGGGGMRRAGR